MNYIKVLNVFETPKSVPGCTWSGWGFEINRDSFYVINTLIIHSSKKEFQVRIPKKQLNNTDKWLRTLAKRKCNVIAKEAIEYMVYELGVYLKNDKI